MEVIDCDYVEGRANLNNDDVQYIDDIFEIIKQAG